MEGKQFCCCGSQGWTRVIGWLQLVGAVIGIISMALLLAGLPYTSSGDAFEKAPGQRLSPGLPRQSSPVAAGTSPKDRNAAEEAFPVAEAVTFGVLIFMYNLSGIMAIVLLIGSYKKNPKFLQAWIVFTVISIVLIAIGGLLRSFFIGNVVSLVPTIISTILTMLIQVFFLWIVRTHKEEIEAEQRPVTASPVNKKAYAGGESCTSYDNRGNAVQALNGNYYYNHYI